jgi:quinoprotein glucose dehydrogenase
MRMANEGSVRLGWVMVSLLALPAPAAQAWQDDRYNPPIEPASDEWQAAVADITPAPGIVVDLFAAEPMLANPVCLWVDTDGSVLVAETFRHSAGVTDIRQHWDWLDDDLASRSVADRLAYIERFEQEAFADYSVEHDRLRLIRDTDGDGLADQATVFADGFRDPAAGIGSGVLAHGGDVYYTCIPDLWLLRDTDGDDVADERRVLSTGYGVKTGLLGHDLHGLRIGPDGRLYFSIGDRALYVETENGVIDHTHTGCVLRCNLDGSDLEVFHTGLRNPQELVFDDHGNLWTGDNNSDGGDEARWVFVVQDGDSGWRFSYQWIDNPVSRGPWNDEQLWHPRHEGQAAYIVPPVDNIANGPSGLTYYPGTGLDASYDGHFFLCDFGGGQQWSGVHSFAVEPDGAGFTLVDHERFLWDTLVTDCDFGPDGALYFTDWVEGWNRTGKGRIFRARDPDLIDDPLVRETATLIREGMGTRAAPELTGLLGHADQRVRQAAQFELVARGDVGLPTLLGAATSSPELLARLHGIWGLGMLGRENPTTLDSLIRLAADSDAEVRAQVFRVLGDERHAGLADALLAGLADEAPRVRLFAAQAAGRIGPQPKLEPALRDALLQLFDDAASDDPSLRHGAVMGLLGTASPGDIWRLTQHASPHVRTGAVLAMRRLRSPLLGNVLETLTLDPGAEHAAGLALELARAIHDVPVPEGTVALAALAAWPQPAPDRRADLVTRFLTEESLPTAAFVRRVLAANRTLGSYHHARRVADFALRDDAPDDLRIEALGMLAEWAEPAPRDPIMGDWRPIAPRDASFLPDIAGRLAEQLQGRLSELGGNELSVVVAFIDFVTACEARDQVPLLAGWVRDSEQPSSLRVAAMDALITLADAVVPELVDVAMADPDGALRAAALPALQAMSAADAWRWLPAIVRDGELAERRVAYDILGSADDLPAGDELLEQQLQLLRAGLVSPELALDLVAAATSRGLSIERHSDASDLGDPLAPWLDTLFGGDAEAGRDVFRRSTLACQRCHSTDADSGFLVGPELAGLGGRLTRLQILTSIIDPNRRQSPGYAGTNVFLHDGSIRSGRVVSESETTLSLLDSDGELHELALALVDERHAGLSAMPEGLDAGLNPKDMRDLIAYLGTL